MVMPCHESEFFVISRIEGLGLYILISQWYEMSIDLENEAKRHSVQDLYMPTLTTIIMVINFCYQKLPAILKTVYEADRRPYLKQLFRFDAITMQWPLSLCFREIVWGSWAHYDVSNVLLAGTRIKHYLRWLHILEKLEWLKKITWISSYSAYKATNCSNYEPQSSEIYIWCINIIGWKYDIYFTIIRHHNKSS